MSVAPEFDFPVRPLQEVMPEELAEVIPFPAPAERLTEVCASEVEANTGAAEMEVDIARDKVQEALSQDEDRKKGFLGSVALFGAITDVFHRKKDQTLALTADSPRVPKAETEKAVKLVTRQATMEDIEGIVALDRKMFNGAYGEVPPEDEVRSMMHRRLENVQRGGGWMYVQEKEGQIKSMMTAFRTNKPAEEFVSWEDSTADGTLDEKIDEDGAYLYVTNLTVSGGGEREVIMGRMFSNAIREGVTYAYFEARMPQFRRWLTGQTASEGKTLDDLDESQLAEKARSYRDLTKTNGKGKQVPHDWQLRMYKNAGMELGPLVPNAFQDADSLNFGVMCTMPIPLRKSPRFVRATAAFAVKTATRFPKIMEKIF